MTKQILTACSLLMISSSIYASQAPAPKKMHPSWDVDKNGVNDCEKDGSCDHTVDYSLPRKVDAPMYTDNFYKAVNKEWLSTHKIDPKMGQISNFTILVNDTNKKLKVIIDKLDKADTLSNDEQKVIDLYRSYMDVEKRNKLGITPLLETFEKINTAKTHEEIAKLFSDLSLIGVSVPFILDINVDKKDSTKMILEIKQSGIGLEKDTYLEKDKRSQSEMKYYKEYLASLLTLAKQSDVPKKVEDMIAIESKLASMQLDRVQLRENRTHYKMLDFKQLDALLSNLNMEYASKTKNYKKNVSFDGAQDAYSKAFNEMFLQTDVESWKTYLTVNYIKAYAGYTSTVFDDETFKYLKKRGLVTEQAPMWERAVSSVKGMEDMLLGKLYIKEYFDEKTKVKAEELVNNIKEEFRNQITNGTLFSQKTKEKALVKLDKMAFNIGYPDTWRDYASLKIDKNDLVGNVKRAVAYKHKLDVEMLDKPVDHNMWLRAPQVINASYMSSFNKFILLAGVLQKPMFDINATDAQNYGGIGMVIAHEIGHGFDSTGSRYDEDGNMVDWWQKEDRVKYTKRTTSLISQADHFEYLPGRHLNGKLEIGEIIADVNGVTIALGAYEKVIKEQGLDREDSLKKFFVQLAKVWRNKTEPHALERIVHTDTHPVSEFRVNGTLKNIDTFHEIFKTKKGDGMYLAPEERVKLW